MDAWSGEQRQHSAGEGQVKGRQGAGLSSLRRPILVVDDDPSILETVRSILESEGHPVITATNGNEALECLERATPGLMLLDMRMPVLDGWGVAAALRDSSHRVPIVVMTAAENASRWAAEIQAEGFLAKPFDLNQLLDTVERYRDRGGRLN